MTAISMQSGEFRNPLETIFSFLDPITLIVLKRVCKFWNKLSENEVLWKAIAKQRGVENGKSVIQSLKMEKSLDIGELIHVQTLKGHAKGVSTLFFLNGQLFSGSLDETVKVWMKKEGIWQEKQTLNGHGDMVRVIRYSDGKLFTQSDRVLKVWQLQGETWKEVESKDEGGTGIIGTIATLGKYTIHGSMDGDIQAMDHDANIWKTIHVNENPHGNMINSTYYAEGKLFTGSFDKTIKIWK